ncbi:hypothetical protein VE00_10816 [Pseudogymnoascus sp. WSF 3629]|nr:hypothetical protein VE00_10816 [Pseudogymnoascus sp. WSF 3629]
MPKRKLEYEENHEPASGDPKNRYVEGGNGQGSTTRGYRRILTHDDYTVGWICPLEVEQIAALEMLDEEHERLPQSFTDHNVYTLGSIAGHNVVVAGLHQPGNNPAATVVT